VYSKDWATLSSSPKRASELAEIEAKTVIDI